MESVLAVEEEVGKCLETGLLAFPTKLEKSLQRTKGKHTLRGRTFISVDIRVSAVIGFQPHSGRVSGVRAHRGAAVIPFVMSLLVVMWSFSVAFVLENKSAASLDLDLRWQVSGNPHESQQDPEKGTTESEYCWVLGLTLKSDFIDVCSSPRLLVLQVQLPKLVDFLQLLISRATENQNS
ncbi:hypothetical protein CB1_000339010 [Camelus ferus]|nr:hypothetical protein CB1_000339010 [Camelus ferus]